MKKYTLTELVKIAETTHSIELLKLIRDEIDNKIEKLCVEYGVRLVEKPKQKRQIGFKTSWQNKCLGLTKKYNFDIIKLLQKVAKKDIIKFYTKYE